jgi:hypothetical protein
MITLNRFHNYDWTSHTPPPLDQKLNKAIVAISGLIFPNGFEASIDAPDTFENLCAHLDAGKPMIVWSGASETTVFGCAEVNWAFRAWHDWCHWHLSQPFTLDGETAVCSHQCQQLRDLFGDTPVTRRWQRILHADIVGQWHHHAMFGEFPKDQRAFVESTLKVAPLKARRPISRQVSDHFCHRAPADRRF